MRWLLVFVVACSASHEIAPDAAPDAPPDAGLVTHRPFPQVVTHGGHTLTSMRLVVITASGDPLQTELDAFCQGLVASQWWGEVTSEFGLGAPRGCVHLIGAAMTSPATMDDTQMTQYIAATIGSTQPDGQTMYLLYLPPGVQFAGNNNCGYNGYHLPYGSGGDAWGVVMRCQFDFSSMLESLTVVGSHEIVEAATDADTTSGWGLYPTTAPMWQQSAWIPYGGGYAVEIGDFCIASHISENGVWYQRQLSNVAAARGDDPCVPALAVPYYNITVPQDWYAVAAGQTVDIPLTAWSTAATQPFQIVVDPADSSTTAPPIAARSIDAPLVTIAGTQFHQFTPGQTSIMHVTMGTGAVSGEWRTFWIYSFRCDSTGADGINGDDHDHLWRVGVYVP